MYNHMCGQRPHEAGSHFDECNRATNPSLHLGGSRLKIVVKSPQFYLDNWADLLQSHHVFEIVNDKPTYAFSYLNSKFEERKK